MCTLSELRPPVSGKFDTKDSFGFKYTKLT
jgi:hypothetical protein